jgi:hypothetical protein
MSGPCGGEAPFCDTRSFSCSASAIGALCVHEPCPDDHRCSFVTCLAVRAPGDPCDAEHACIGRCEDGVCFDVVPPDALCDASVRCPWDWSCIDGRCTYLAGLGEPCTGECREGACIEGRCEHRPEGASCSWGECEHGCRDGTCASPVAVVGAPCDFGIGCRAPLVCSPRAGSGICLAPCAP